MMSATASAGGGLLAAVGFKWHGHYNRMVSNWASGNIVLRSRKVTLAQSKSIVFGNAFGVGHKRRHFGGSSLMNQSSTFFRAQGVLRRNVRLDFTLGLN
jgi:hypothetical protein